MLHLILTMGNNASELVSCLYMSGWEITEYPRGRAQSQSCRGQHESSPHAGRLQKNPHRSDGQRGQLCSRKGSEEEERREWWGRGEVGHLLYWNDFRNLKYKLRIINFFFFRGELLSLRDIERLHKKPKSDKETRLATAMVSMDYYILMLKERKHIDILSSTHSKEKG